MVGVERSFNPVKKKSLRITSTLCIISNIKIKKTMNIMNLIQPSVVGGTYLLASSFFRQDLKEVARSTDL